MSETVIILSLISVVIFTAGITFLFRSKIEKIKNYINTFTSSIVASLIFIHILPESYSDGGFNIGIFVLLGLMSQLTLERMTGGIEHGHIHSERNTKSKRTVILGLMLGLCMHSFLEGVPLLSSANAAENHSEHVHEHAGHTHLTIDNDNEHTNSFFIAIVNHKVPVTIVLSLFLISLGITNLSFVLLMGTFAIATPLGAYFGKLIGQNEGFDHILPYLVAFSTGMLLHIVTAILFEHSHSKKSAVIHISLIASGLLIGILLF